jgi:hypothetical protein
MTRPGLQQSQSPALNGQFRALGPESFHGLLCRLFGCLSGAGFEGFGTNLFEGTGGTFAEHIGICREQWSNQHGNQRGVKKGFHGDFDLSVGLVSFSGTTPGWGPGQFLALLALF